MPTNSEAKPKRRRPRKSGRKRKWHLTPARAAANRTRAWKHGRYARTVTAREVVRSDLERKIPGCAEVVEAYHAALEGDISALDPIAARALTESEILRRRLVDDVGNRGILIEEDLFGADGEVVGSRLKAHPGLEAIGRFSEQLGHTAEDMMLTRKSRGEGFRDLAIAARFARDEMLRQADKSQMPLPPPRKA